MMEVVVTAKLHSNRHQHKPKLNFFTVWMPFLLPNHQCQETNYQLFISYNKSSIGFQKF